MDGRSGRAGREVPDKDPGVEAQAAFQPLDPAELAEPVGSEMLGQENSFHIRTCPQCGAEDAADARFCRQCGASFTGAAPEDGRWRISPVWAAVAVVLLLALAIGGVFAYRALTPRAPATAAPLPPVSSAAPAIATAPPSAAPAPAPPAPPADASARPPVPDLQLEPGPARAPPPRAAARIVDPVWLLRPNPEEVAALYPSLAAEENRGGEAVIDCAVTAFGRLSACKVVAQRPAHYGFGAATLRLASRFRMRSTTRSHQPVAGRRVRVPVRWRLDD
jgi:TonB family protein